MKLLKLLFIYQEKIDKNGFAIERINPYNPLSYFYIVLVVVVGFMLAGPFYYKEINQNPFKWN